MTGLMTILIEAEDLTNCTPATISRCAMIYMKDDIIPLKAIINRWIKSLPKYLEECAQEIDLLCNYFIPEILENFIHQTNLVRFKFYLLTLNLDISSLLKMGC